MANIYSTYKSWTCLRSRGGGEGGGDEAKFNNTGGFSRPDFPFLPATSLIFPARAVLFFAAARIFASFSHCPRHNFPRHKPPKLHFRI